LNLNSGWITIELSLPNPPLNSKYKIQEGRQAGVIAGDINDEV
jgi:hypothetical protein